MVGMMNTVQCATSIFAGLGLGYSLIFREHICVIASRDDLPCAGWGSNLCWDYEGNSRFVCDFTVLNSQGLPYFHAASHSLERNAL